MVSSFQLIRSTRLTERTKAAKTNLSPSRIVDSRSLVGLAHLDPAAIDYDGGQLDRRTSGRRRRHHRAIFRGGRLFSLLIDIDFPLFLAERLEVAGRDLQFRGDGLSKGRSEKSCAAGFMRLTQPLLPWPAERSEAWYRIFARFA